VAHQSAPAIGHLLGDDHVLDSSGTENDERPG
jgi:hypothetical protein